MSEEKKTTSETQEQVKPFVIDHEYAMKAQQNSMVPSDGNDNEESSVADELKVPEKKKENEEPKPKKKTVKEKLPTPSKEPAPKSGLKRMFNILPEGMIDPNHKKYLVLLYITSTVDNLEDGKDFFFENGRQATYDRIKHLLENDWQVDCMKSLVFVDSPKVTIATRTSVYTFMKDVREQKKVIDDTSFDIEDYYYEVDDKEESEE